MDLKEKISHFLNKNLVLDKNIIKEIKSSINELSEVQLKSIYKVLSDLDRKQTLVLQEKLKETPWFFTQVEIDLSKEMYNKHIQEEMKDKEIIEAKVAELFKN